MDKNVEFSSGEGSSSPISRSSGWKPQETSNLPVEPPFSSSPTGYSKSSQPLRSSVEQTQPTRIKQNYVSSPDQMKHEHTSQAGKRRIGHILMLLFWGIIGFIALFYTLFVGVDLFKYGIYSPERLFLLIYPIISIFAIIMFLRSWKAKDTKNSSVKGTKSTILRGEVSGFRERLEQKGSSQYGSPAPDIIWSFRVERYQDGRRLSPVPVEMRGVKFKGFINEGDTIEISDRWREGEIVRPKQVFNITNNARVIVQSAKKAVFATLFVIFVLFLFGGFIFFIVLVFSQ